MKNKMYHEIFREFEQAKSPTTRRAVLQKYGNHNFKEFLNFAFHPEIKFDVKEIPDYKPSIMPEGLNYSYLHMEVPKLYVFLPMHKKYRAKLQPHREKAILTNILQALHKEEAKLLVKVIKKQLDVKYLTPKTVKDAFPDMPFGN